jgi:large subunit ribosomal protein L33
LGGRSKISWPEIKHDMREIITLACSECKQRNYSTTKDKKNHPEKLELRKYCKFCQTHTLHKETK